MSASEQPSSNQPPPDGDHSAEPVSSSQSSLSPTSTVDSLSGSARNIPLPATPRVTFSYDEDHPGGSRVASPLPAQNSPTRGRNRGYSLRRSIFAQNIKRRASEHERPIELERQASASKKSTISTREGEISAPANKAANINSASERRRRRVPFWKHWLSALSALPHRIDQIFERKSLPPSLRGRNVTVTAARSEPLLDDRTGKPHVDNTIVSCRYTPWNFFPRQLIAQFSKLANFYFLIIAILQMIPGLSTTGQYTTIVPLMIFVLISMAKEGYDDLRRHRLDKEDNLREVDVLVHQTLRGSQDRLPEKDFSYPETDTAGWSTKKWQDVAVGDVVLLERDEPTPADVVLLHADEPTEAAFVETKSLDGETNLKTKKPLKDLSGRCSTLDAVVHLEADFVVEDPNLDLYKFEGKVTVGGQTLPLTNGEVIYRGSVLRNMPAALGLVIYTGKSLGIDLG
ncbi:uncharacterized protein HMPREF1541_09771 [Cyphellophora europaea CBS 101466]|uniref:P-type ATPase N-terminal domain-containing protein n=1 Tax=Cyphellophora europaea (strain CBS 101466) TaxID=1220924 RepID=W2S884_CYPE1|nr:uncharacterized protein HMPREF1541_09771 [Cyphellophora europaea CBS 101466]ETN44896.1 hypothetical protein HMPREF1541_09771 [Cyphellophora europaea CBS 101466]